MWYSPSIGTRNDLMNPNLSTLLTQTEHVMSGANAWHADPGLISPVGTYRGVLHVGVDLGTAYTVLVVLDEHYKPIAGEYHYAELVRDGLLVHFIGPLYLPPHTQSSLRPT